MKIFVDQLSTCQSCGFKGIIGISFAANWGWNVDTGCTLIKGDAEIDGRREDCPLAVLPTIAQATAQEEKAVESEPTAPPEPAIVYGSFTDPRDGKTYRTVKIGKQEWLAENLNYECAGSWCYDNDPANGDKYGRLYNWHTAMIAVPVGWHLPSDVEWTALVNFVNTSTPSTNNAGGKLKSQTGWTYGNGEPANNGTDTHGFSALPGGYRYSDGSFDNAGNYGGWWSATEGDAGRAWYRGMYYNYDLVGRDGWDEAGALSVRCVREGK